MNDTIRYNLDLREKIKRKPTKNFRATKKQHLRESKNLTEAERKQLLLSVKGEQENEKRKQIIILFISSILTLILLLLTWWIFS
ncbi:MAG: hypothetical protein HRU69_08835 [Flammeovirgaceae bacterium]|nr:MAG: hypothetical protein HRU69_08835 [Flammeovirgaceae bacterium]